jgi:putative membrane protein
MKSPQQHPADLSALAIFWRGLAMGAADIVPGVSGGTVALITGIYERLLAAIAAADRAAIADLFAGRFSALWRRFDGGFLLPLLAGIATAVLTLAKGINWLMSHHPLPLWSFFFGLVLVSVAYLVRSEAVAETAGRLLLMFLGIVVAVGIGLAPSTGFVSGHLGFFLAGSLAICAMILPGISGSFILLLLGMYAPVIRALVTPELSPLMVFVLGCVTGLLAFSKVLNYLIGHRRGMTMALLTGFLLGSLTALWPWRVVLESVLDRHGELRAVQTLPVLPSRYLADVADPQLLLCLSASLVGGVIIMLAHRITKPSSAAVT